jgi:hypothetical protein
MSRNQPIRARRLITKTIRIASQTSALEERGEDKEYPRRIKYPLWFFASFSSALPRLIRRDKNYNQNKVIIFKVKRGGESDCSRSDCSIACHDRNLSKIPNE